jgi:uncharacterized protein YndB with AHSA1/START domain
MNTIKEKVEFSILVRVEIEKVFDAIATQKGLDGWFTSDSTVEDFEGGRIIFRWKNWGVDKYKGESKGTVIKYERPTQFVFSWTVHESNLMSKVEINLKSDERGTIIRLEESNFPDTDTGRQKMLENAVGWGEALTLLKFYVEHGVIY